MSPEPELRKTVLHELHAELGAKFGPFAGWKMPLTYADGGAIAEHEHTRASASLFDVSHMGVVLLHGDDPAAALETLVPGGITTLKPGKARYTFFTNDAGGILDDLIVTRLSDQDLMVVVNAGRKDHDVAHLSQLTGVDVDVRDDLKLVALQGPAAVGALAAIGIDVGGLSFMQAAALDVGGQEAHVSRSGYSGEDGFELALPEDQVVMVAQMLLAEDAVRPAGLVARDSLRLEAGLCLYGNDLDETTTPVEAELMWAIPKRRREAGDYPGGAVVAEQLAQGATRRRVGIGTDQRRPIRPGNHLQDADGNPVGVVTSGGFGPSLGAPVAMGYVTAEVAEPGTPLMADVRGKQTPCSVADLPFIPHRYQR